MSEYIITCDEETASWIGNDVGSMRPLVRCRDCKHATISTLGFCKYCEMWVLPDDDGYGCDSRVNLPLDFFCAYGKRKEGGEC